MTDAINFWSAAEIYEIIVSLGNTTPVGKYSPTGDSPYGCSDMAGNVSEWCADWYENDYYSDSGANNNPRGPSSGHYRILRGGAFYFISNAVRSSKRFGDRPDHLCSPYGFRCVMNPL